MNNMMSLWYVVGVMAILLVACIVQEIINSNKNAELKNRLMEQGLIKDGGKHGSNR